jgi:TRAP-type transport system small permease protein
MPSKHTGQKVSTFVKLAGEKPVSLLNALSAVTLMAILILTAVDVVGRYGFNSPVRGKTELTRVMMAVMITLALPGAILRGHSIVVDLLDAFFNRRIALVRDLLMNLLCAGAMFTLAYWVYLLGLRQQRWNNVTDLLKIPTYPVTFLIATLLVVGGVMFIFRVVADVNLALRPNKSRDPYN